MTTQFQKVDLTVKERLTVEYAVRMQLEVIKAFTWSSSARWSVNMAIESGSKVDMLGVMAFCLIIHYFSLITIPF